VLACAGLDRLGLADRIAERLEPEIVPPAPGQGAIAIQIRHDDANTLALLASVDNRPTRLAVEAERAFLSASGGGCRAPIGALASVADEELDLLGGYASPNGSTTVVARRRGPISTGAQLGRSLAAEIDPGGRIRAAGSFGPEPARSGRRRVLVPRAAGQADELVSAMHNAGLDPVPVPTIAVQFEPPHGDLDTVAGLLHTYAWVVVTSGNGARAILKAAERILTELGAPSWAAIGAATRRVLEQEGIEVTLQPSQSSAIALAIELPVVNGDRVLIVRGDLADEELAVALRARGALVDDVVAYRTGEAPEASRLLLRRALSEGPIAAVAFTSGSTVRGLVKLGRDESIDVLSIPSVCIGPETADEARAAGFHVLAISPAQESAALAAATARALALQPQENS
jgi:uroporphyrinogen-III synthase